MSKNFKLYIVGWAAALGLFNVVTFVTPAEIDGISKYDTLFWIAYAFITLFFIGQLSCSYFVFHSKSTQKTFYNISLFTISVSALITMLMVGGLCMAVIQIPEWIGIIACSIVLAVNIIAIVKASIAIGTIGGIDDKINATTAFTRSLTADAQVLITKAKSDDAGLMAKKVFEELRYSDPMSNADLREIEEKISIEFKNFSREIETDNIDSINNSCSLLLSLIKERNARCKLLK